MIPFLTYPFAAFGLLTLPLLAGIYFFRNRFRRCPVSSLLLWEAVSASRQGGIRLKRARFPVLFFIELAVLLFLVTAALDPRWATTGSSKPLVVVLDDSASMGAVTAGKSSRERAIDAVLREIHGGSFYSVRVVFAGSQPRMLDALDPASPLVDAALDRWTCRAPMSDMEAAIGTAREVGGESSRILVVSDHPPGQLPDVGALQWWSFGRATPNIGIVNANRTPSAVGDRCFIEIANYNNRPAGGRIEIRLKGKIAQSRVLEFEPMRSIPLVFNVPTGSGVLHAELENDALFDDNHCVLLEQKPRLVQTTIHVSNNRLADLTSQAVDATGLRSGLVAAPQLLFTDSEPYPAVGPDTWVVRLFCPDKASAFIGPFVVDNTHPVCAGLSLAGVIWGASPTNEIPGTPIAMAGNIPLVADFPRLSGGHDISLQLRPELSSLQDTPNWPAIIWNIMSWRARHLPGVHEKNLRIGMKAQITVPSTAEPLVKFPSGKSHKLVSTMGSACIVASESGVYDVRTGNSAFSFAANFLAADESNLTSAESGRWGMWIDTESLQREYASSAWLFALVALVCMTTQLFFAVRSGKKGRNRAPITLEQQHD